MKFYSGIEGNLIVLIGKKELVFVDGEFDTTDAKEIELLSKYYKHDEVTDEPEELTKAQIMQMLDDKGIEYNKRNNKSELMELLED